MSTWIRVTDRIARAVAVQVQGLRLRPASAVSVLCQEAAVFRAVVAGVEVVEACGLVVNSAAVADLVIEIILTLLGRFTVVGVAVGLLRSSVLANDVDGALAKILGVGVEIYCIILSRSCCREDVVLCADQVEAAYRIVLVLRVQDCRAVVEIFSCIRAFLFPDSLSKSIILVLLGIINCFSSFPCRSCQTVIGVIAVTDLLACDGIRFADLITVMVVTVSLMRRVSFQITVFIGRYQLIEFVIGVIRRIIIERTFFLIFLDPVSSCIVLVCAYITLIVINRKVFRDIVIRTFPAKSPPEVFSQ